ncbi:MAG: hypothetical protein COZ06_35375 [Armatimonadetes bacterium CG_4_10_14_3_um_filter_66_18]|nr:MAG: hypothetical protein COS65_27425 [Armatimonadetes bacterium CG06_land_8_20_14_3_00_66_21]PIX41205.1 MAG: hypothetical protein COZ57_24005 [Armatimonadetes bacterium CG_4_8_14_3_um_filter_66_20]PIY36648.1 MAG: hypothetical protein COZ06_35375 [Armatimonadetes bacterium CG_4_10_14_3_um_filter_66_18]
MTDALPRFLALCKVRYLPALSFHCDYFEHETHLQQFWHDEGKRREIQALTEDEFYREYVAGGLIFG